MKTKDIKCDKFAESFKDFEEIFKSMGTCCSMQKESKSCMTLMKNIFNADKICCGFQTDAVGPENIQKEN